MHERVADLELMVKDGFIHEDWNVVEKFGFVGGHVALDLVNTVHWRLSPSRRFDALASGDDLASWGLRAGVLSPVPGEAGSRRAPSAAASHAGVADEVRTLREAFYRAAVLDDADEAGYVAEAYRLGLAGAALVRRDDAWVWDDGPLAPETLSARLSRSMIELLTGDQRSLIRQCADDECGWVYLDTSRAHNRRWCSATGCGDRNRAREYYRRQTGKTR